MYPSISKLRLLLFPPLLLFSPTSSAYVQFCKPNPTISPDLCLALSTYENTTSSSHDFYLSLTFRRPTASPLGWTAVGIGAKMAAALMIVVYGDPATSQAPTVSIRTASGHHQPTLLSEADEDTRSKADVRVVSAVWEPSTDKAATQATISLLYYSRAVKPLLSASQPWIWASNPTQELSSFGLDAKLNIHSAHGDFYVDMPRSISPGPSPPEFPFIYPSRLNVGTSGNPMPDPVFQPGTTTPALNPTLRANLWHLHGLLMSTSLFFLFPLGILAIASSSPKAFTYHWTLQLLASILALLGITLGIMLSTAIVLVHQYVGFLVTILLFLQVAVGYRHHILFLRFKRRSWVSTTHVWLGRSVVVVGWLNLVAGMWRGGYGKFSIGAVELLMVVEMMVLVLWVGRKGTRTRKHAGEGGRRGAAQIVMRDEDGEEFFALVGAGEEEGEEGSDEDGKGDGV